MLTILGILQLTHELDKLDSLLRSRLMKKFFY
jgi:hypothetical protein